MSFAKPWGNYLLEAIVETKAPETISFWPETLAWQIIFIVMIFMFIKKIYQKWQHYQANAYRREALFWLEQCSVRKEEDVRQLPSLLRKTAILANNRQLKESDDVQSKAIAIKDQQDIIELSGQAWVSWLDLHCSKSQFQSKNSESVTAASSCESLLSQLAYRKNLNLNDEVFNQGLIKLKQQMALWIKYHEMPTKSNALAHLNGSDGVKA